VVYLTLLVVKTEGSTLQSVGGKDTPMLSIHQVEGAREEQLVLDLDEIARQGAKKMLTQALETGSKPISMRPGTRATSKVAPWWCVNALLDRAQHT
jgi:hypothetical protein